MTYRAQRDDKKAYVMCIWLVSQPVLHHTLLLRHLFFLRHLSFLHHTLLLHHNTTCVIRHFGLNAYHPFWHNTLTKKQKKKPPLLHTQPLSLAPHPIDVNTNNPLRQLKPISSYTNFFGAYIFLAQPHVHQIIPTSLASFPSCTLQPPLAPFPF